MFQEAGRHYRQENGTWERNLEKEQFIVKTAGKLVTKLEGEGAVGNVTCLGIPSKLAHMDSANQNTKRIEILWTK